MEETAVPRQSQAGRPEEGEAANGPGGIINRAFERKLSFPKHMCKDLIKVSHPQAPIQWVQSSGRS